MAKSRLYLVTDKDFLSRHSLADTVRRLKNSGVGIIQLREKNSKKEDILFNACTLARLCRKNNIILIINDYLDIAKIIDSDGIHLGQSDASIGIARKILGRDKIIGISCHNLPQAKKAEAEGADYIGIGPIFATPTKPKAQPIGLKIIKKIKGKLKIPFFVIGGINEKNIGAVLSSGARKVAVASAICQSNDPASAARFLRRALN